MLASQQFCVKWNSYTTNLQNVFPRLLSSEHFVDLTLACEGRMIKCHKVVLSACSTYFEKLLVHNPCQHPIIFMKDMKHWEVQALVDFMYKGEVNVSQDELNSLLEAAEALQIRGLCGSDQSTSTAAAVARSNPPQDSGSVSTATPSDRDSPPAKRPRRSADEDDSGGTGPALDSGLTEKERSSNGGAAMCEKKDIKQDIKQEPDTDDNFAETEVDDERQDDNYANHEPQDDSDSKDPPPSPLDLPGPSGQSIVSSHHAVNSEKSSTGSAGWLDDTGVVHALVRREGLSRFVRRRCRGCYLRMRQRDTGRRQAENASRKVVTFCSGCRRCPAMCTACFTHFHSQPRYRRWKDA